MSAIGRRRAGRRAAVLSAAATAAALAGCASMHRAFEPAPASRPSADEGMLVYTVGRLSFEAPADWSARGDSRKVTFSPGDGMARLEAEVVDRSYRDETACLAGAEDALGKGSAGLVNARRHPTTVAGRRAITQEADRAGWHGWAYAVCDGPVQYRIFLAGVSPLRPETLRAQRLLVASAQIGGSP